MPRLIDENMTSQVITGSNFSFSGTRLESLGATEYTLVTIAIDVTGSTGGFSKELREMLLAAIDACKKSPRAENLLARVVLFSSQLDQGVSEIHGFVPLNQIKDTDYPEFSPWGATPLFDAVYSSVGAMVQYGDDLMQNDFMTNGIIFIITDGEDNVSTKTPRSIKKVIDDCAQKEQLESLVTILIGINVAGCRPALEDFQQKAGLDQFIDAGDATKGKLAKLAQFVSQSVSSTSQALGTGGPSQNISASL